MTEPQQDQPRYTPEQLEAIRAQGQSAQPPGTGIPAGSDAALGAQLAAGQAAAGQAMGATEVDPAVLLAAIQEMQARLDALEKEKRDTQGVPLVNTAEALRALVAVHDAHTPAIDHAEALSMADDLVDAAGNAVDSGDGTHVTGIAAKLHRWLTRHHPGPGDHPYYRQALDFAGPHMEDALEGLQPPRRPVAGQLPTSRPPAKVIPGNVTG